MTAGESWLTLAELLDVDYDQIIEDRCGPDRHELPAGQGHKMPLREFLGEWFVDRIHWLQRFGDPNDVRIVFTFDV